MKSRSRRELIEEIKKLRKTNSVQAADLAMAKADATIKGARVESLEMEIKGWRKRMEEMENDPDLEYIGSTPGRCETVASVPIEFVQDVMRRWPDQVQRDFFRKRMVEKLTEGMIDRGLVRIQYDDPDPYDDDHDAARYGLQRIRARVDVLPWDSLVRRNRNQVHVLRKPSLVLREDGWMELKFDGRTGGVKHGDRGESEFPAADREADRRDGDRGEHAADPGDAGGAAGRI